MNFFFLIFSTSRLYSLFLCRFPVLSIKSKMLLLIITVVPIEGCRSCSHFAAHRFWRAYTRRMPAPVCRNDSIMELKTSEKESLSWFLQRRFCLSTVPFALPGFRTIQCYCCSCTRDFHWMENPCLWRCSCKAKSQGHQAEVCSSSGAVPSVATSALKLSLLTMHFNSDCSHELLKTFFCFLLLFRIFLPVPF